MINPTTIFASSIPLRLGVLLFVAGYVELVSADVVWLAGQSTALSGQIVSTAPDQIELQVFENGKLGRIEKIARSQIEQFISNIDIERLERLSPDNPADYRDYAEELAAQRIDLAAQNLARRLYLIAAANSAGNNRNENRIRYSALSGLIAIAESDVQRGRLTMLRSMVSPEAVHVEAAPESKTSARFSEEHDKLMLRLILAMRKENSKEAIELLSSLDNQEIFQNWSEFCSLKELQRIARVNRPSMSQLSKLLRIELQIRSRANALKTENPNTIQSAKRKNWGDFAMQGSGLLSLVPSFENATTIDPSQSVYRAGEWVRPETTSRK